MITTNKPTLQEFQIEGVKHISPTDAMEALTNNEAVLIDVREVNEVGFESIPLNNVLYHPMSVIMERLAFISKNQNIIVACPGGVRSSKVVNLLNKEGYPNVANLDGGLSTWKTQGLPFKSNLIFSGGCGCGVTSSKGNSCCN